MVDISKKASNTAQIIKLIGCDKLSLRKADGYLYFCYDDPAANVFETESISTTHLKNQTIAAWVADGQAFLKRVQEELADSSGVQEVDGVLRVVLKPPVATLEEE